MTANPILLQKKYARVIALFSQKAGISLDAGLQFFYQPIAWSAKESLTFTA